MCAHCSNCFVFMKLKRSSMHEIHESDDDANSQMNSIDILLKSSEATTSTVSWFSINRNYRVADGVLLRVENLCLHSQKHSKLIMHALAHSLVLFASLCVCLNLHSFIHWKFQHSIRHSRLISFDNWFL